MGELETIVRRLESGDVSLEESVALYERGHALRAHCEARLAAAQARIEQVSLGADGQPSGTAPFGERSEEHTSELQSLMRISYAVFCLKKTKTNIKLKPETTDYHKTNTIDKKQPQEDQH